MNTDQIQSLVRSGLKIVAGALVAHGLTSAASIVNTEDVAGLIAGLIGLWLSHRNHAAPPTQGGQP